MDQNLHTHAEKYFLAIRGLGFPAKAEMDALENL
jgi:hypothetical protein